MFIDTHAHLTHPDFSGDLDQIVKRAQAAGVETMVCVATNLEDSHHSLEIAQRYQGVHAAVGLHPADILKISLSDVIELGGLASDSKVVALGEMGLDYRREAEDDPELRQKQKEFLWAQLEAAKEHNMPVVIHNRGADKDLIEILRAHAEGLPKPWRPWGVMHCFSGDEKFAFGCIEIGLMISYTGILTFKNAVALRGVAQKVSLDSVMLETDAPYLAPVPHRGKRNEPAYVPLVAEVLAQVKKVSVEEIGQATSQNALRLFGIES